MSVCGRVRVWACGHVGMWAHLEGLLAKVRLVLVLHLLLLSTLLDLFRDCDALEQLGFGDEDRVGGVGAAVGVLARRALA